MISLTIDGIPGVYGYGDDPGTVSGWQTLLADAPDLSADAVDPHDGVYTGARLRASITANAQTRRRLLHQATDAAATLASGIGSATTSLTLTAPISTPPEAFYIGAETLRVVSQTTSTSFIVERGSYGSKAASYSAGSGVYIAPPWWRRRRVRLWRHDVQLWVGLLDDAPATSDEGTTIEIVGAHILTLGSDLTVGAGRQTQTIKGAETPQSVYLYWPLDQVFTLPSGMPPGISSQIAEPFQMQETLCFAPGWYTKAALPSSDPFKWLMNASSWDAPFFAQLDSPTLDYTSDIPVTPVLAIGAELAYPTPLHVVEVVGNLLFSDGSMPTTYDDVEFSLFSSRWSAQLRDYTDDDAIAEMRALIAALPDATVDRLVLGWNGEAVAVLDVCRKLLAGYGLSLCASSSGAITVRRIEAANARSSTKPLQPLRDTVKWQQPSVGAIDEARATYGATPWDSGTSQAVQVQDFDTVRGEVVELALDHISPTRAREHGLSELLSLAMRRWRGTPRLDVRCTDAAPIGLLDYVRLYAHKTLETPLFPLPDLTETNDVERAEFVGQVVSRRWLPESGAYELTVHLSSWPNAGLLRLRAPALVVDSAAPGAITVEDDSGWGSTEEGLEWPGYAVNVELWSADGARVSAAGVGVASYYDSGSTELIMSTDFATTPGAGDVIRLARGAQGTLALDPREYVILLTGGDRYQ